MTIKIALSGLDADGFGQMRRRLARRDTSGPVDCYAASR